MSLGDYLNFSQVSGIHQAVYNSPRIQLSLELHNQTLILQLEV